MDFRVEPAAATEARPIRSWRLDVVYVAVVMILVVAFGVVRLRFWHIRHPVLFAGDVDLVFEYIKNALRNGSTTVDPQIGYPDRASLAAFPVFDALSAGVLKVIALFTTEPATGANLLAYADHAISGVIGYLCLRVLRVPRASAVACAVAFAWVEFGLFFVRVFAHEALQLYAPVAIGATIALIPAARPELLSRRRGVAGLLACSALVGLAQPYWVAFSLIAIAASAVGCLASARYRAAALLVAGATAMATVAAACLAWPRLWGEPGLVIQRSPFEQPIYGLRLLNLLLPTRSAFFPALNDFYANYLHKSSGVTEGFDAFVGWPGLIGLVLAMLLILRMPFAPGRWRASTAELAGLLIVLLVLFAQSSGLGELFNLIVTPEIRAQNRVSPLVAFLALVVFADVARRFTRGSDGGWRRIGAAAVPLVVAFGLYDASAGLDYTALQAAPGAADRLEEARATAQALSDALPPGAKILQLPAMRFPESPPVGALGSYAQMDVALFTEGFHYSFGSSNAADVFDRPSPVANAIIGAALGFDELLLYRAGYPAGLDAIVGPLQDTLHLSVDVDTPAVVGFDLRPLRDGLPPTDAAQVPAQVPVRVDWDGHGFSVIEHEADTAFRWDDSRDGRGAVVIDNPSASPVPMRFCASIVSPTPGAYQVTVDAAGQVTRPPADPAATKVDVAFEAPPGRSSLSVAMVAPRLVTPPAETRMIHFRMLNPVLVPKAVLDRAQEISVRLGLPTPAVCP